MFSPTFLPGDKSNKISKKAQKPVNVVVRKPGKRSESCTTALTEDHISNDEKVLNEVKQTEDLKKSISVTKSESIPYWLKPGLSLPRVHLEEKISLEKKVSEKQDSEEAVYNGNISKVFHGVYSKKDGENVPVSTLCPTNSYFIPSFKFDESFDECQNVFGLSKCKINFQTSFTDFNFANINITDETLEESHALKQWEIWLKRRKRLQEYLKKKLNRSASDLVLNRSETFRQVGESEAAEAYLKVLELEHKGAKGTKKKELILCKSKCFGESVPKRKIPEIEIVGLPEIIKNEKKFKKNIEKTSKAADDKFEKALIYQKKRPCISAKGKGAKTFELHCVDIEKLAVVGRKYPAEISEDFSTEDNPYIHDLIPKTENKLLMPRADRKSIIWLAVGDKEIKHEFNSDFHQPSPDEYFTWTIDFGPSPANTVLEKTLRVENKGTVAVSYEWIGPVEESEKTDDSITSSLVEPRFFFNKNSGIFVPNQTYDLKFYGYSKSTGKRKEVWNMEISPPIQERNNKLQIILSLFTIRDYSEPEISSVKKYLNRRVGIAIAKKILNNILTAAMNPRYSLEKLEYRSLISDKMMFEFQNPKHYYNSYVLKDLKKMYLRIVCVPQRDWDLSLTTLLNFITTCVKENSQREALKKKVSETSRELLRPSYVIESKNKKHRMAYHILAPIFNSIETDWDYYKNSLMFRLEEKVSDCFFDDDIFSEEMRSEEESGASSAHLYELGPINLLFFRRMFYLTIYCKLCEAAERIAGMLQSLHFIEPPKRNLNSRTCAEE